MGNENSADLWETSLNTITDNDTRDVIYVLKLCDGKYYVGKTNNITRRLSEHIRGEGCEWTKFYPPSGDNPIEVYPCLSPVDEDYRVKLMMVKCGIDNVRGGSYCTPTLRETQIFVLEKEMNTANDVCFKCGKSGHYANKCANSTSTPISTTCHKCGKSGHTEFTCGSIRDIRLNCTKCGRNGHSAVMCYAKSKQA